MLLRVSASVILFALLLGSAPQHPERVTVAATGPAILVDVPIFPTTTTSTSTTSTTAAPAPPSAPPVRPAAGLPGRLRRIGGCESSGSATGPLLWTRQNPTSTASGAFQMLDSTFAAWVREFLPSLVGRWARAMQAPPDVQMELAERAYDRYGTGPWVSSAPCWA